MISRRDVLVGAAAAAVAVFGRRATSVLAIASQPVTPVKFAVPAGACDCHTHIFGDSRRFPFALGRTYTPEPASIQWNTKEMKIADPFGNRLIFFENVV